MSLTRLGATYKWNRALLVWKGYSWVGFWRWISGQKKTRKRQLRQREQHNQRLRELNCRETLGGWKEAECGWGISLRGCGARKGLEMLLEKTLSLHIRRTSDTEGRNIFNPQSEREKSPQKSKSSRRGMCCITQSCPSLCNPMACSPLVSSVRGDSPGKITGVGCHALLQGMFPTQESNPGLLHGRRILYHLSHQGSPRILEWVAYPFSRGTFWTRNWISVSCIADRFLTSWATQAALQVWAPYLLYMNLARVLVRGWFSDTHCFW